jgi:hypothetical protein
MRHPAIVMLIRIWLRAASEKALPAGNRGARIRGLNIHPGAMAIGFNLLVFALSDAAVMLVGK